MSVCVLGFIETISSYWIAHTRSSATLKAPALHQIMVTLISVPSSILYEDPTADKCGNDLLCLHVSNEDPPSYCFTDVVAFNLPQLLPSESLLVQLVSRTNTSRSAYRFYFSFHSQSALPERLQNGKY